MHSSEFAVVISISGGVARIESAPKHLSVVVVDYDDSDHLVSDVVFTEGRTLYPEHDFTVCTAED